MQLDCPFSLTQAKAHHVVIKVRANVHRQEYVSCDEAVFIHSKEPCIESEATCTMHITQTHSAQSVTLILQLLRTPAPLYRLIYGPTDTDMEAIGKAITDIKG